MSHIKITDPQRDIARLNRGLQELDTLHHSIDLLEARINRLQRSQVALSESRTTAGTNDLTFAWTNGTATVSWAAGFVRDHDGVKVHHVPAGNRVLTAGTEYWAGWNPVHQTMSFETNLDTLQTIKNIIVICRIETGSVGDGTAGGGGSETAGVGILNKEYVFV